MLKKLIHFWYGTMEGADAHYLAHFMGGFVLSVIIGHYFGLNVGVIFGAIAALLKEVLDKLTGMGTAQASAALITSAGAYLAYFILLH